MAAACLEGECGGFGRIGPEAHRAHAAEKALQMAAFPKPHARGDPARVILAPGAGLCFERRDGVFERAEPVAARVIPFGIEDHRAREELCAAERAAPAWQGH